MLLSTDVKGVTFSVNGYEYNLPQIEHFIDQKLLYKQNGYTDKL